MKIKLKKAESGKAGKRKLTRLRSADFQTRRAGEHEADWQSAIQQVGQPAPPPARFRFPAFSLSALQQAFTLIEIMIVVIIIGILAATIIPQFMGTTNDAKVSASKGHIAELATAVERFNLHMDRYPTVEEGLKVLVESPTGEQTKWRGPYITQLRDDPWGNPYQYRAPGIHHPTSFDIWSRGKDGADGGEGEGADIGNW